jgi:putative ABC transport system permease protein
VQVQFGQSAGLTTTAGGSTQHTGAATVLGLPDGYATTFPRVIRSLTGGGTGVLLAQQTAANLHAAPGDSVTIALSGAAPVNVRIDGVVDLPTADTLFQKVGAPPGSQPTAPPDNVLILPSGQWHQVFDPLAASRPDLITTQLHVRLSHSLPSDPAAAYTQVLGLAHNVEARAAGAAVVGDNLAASLASSRQDAAYAQVLFLFLGLPGAVLAGLLTATVTSAGRDRRRSEQALLRARGATTQQLGRLAAVEAAVVTVTGCVVGLLIALVLGRWSFGTASFGATRQDAIGWSLGAVAVGAAIAIGAVLLPARRDARAATVLAGRASLPRPTATRWTRYGLDFAFLAGSLLVFWISSGNGYQLVLAPEGVPTISVSYWAFAGPGLLWIGAGLLAWRLSDLMLSAGRRLVRFAVRPLTGNLAGTAASTMSRQRRSLARAIVLLGLAFAFAASTATFNATYRQQSEADAQLTNGADVTATAPVGSTDLGAAAANVRAIGGVRAVEQVQHRFGYVGSDLQDLFGVHPATIRKATALQDAYFTGGSAGALMNELAAKPDSILVSAETVKDFQLKAGDLINLRLPVAKGQLITVPFHYVGVVTEFPTAPKDSFFVANADYLAQRTGLGSANTLLIDTGGRSMAQVADRVRSTLGPGVTVTDIATTRRVVGSSLTAVDLAGLTRIELGFGAVLATAAGALVLALGLSERRRSFAIATALGATGRQLRGLVLSETVVLTVGGVVTGAVAGWALSQMVVKVLTGVFDPPPSQLALPWLYLGSVAGITVVALLGASVGMTLSGRRPVATILREL